MATPEDLPTVSSSRNMLYISWDFLTITIGTYFLRKMRGIDTAGRTFAKMIWLSSYLVPPDIAEKILMEGKL